ncbi:ATP-binding protein [Herbaspirillum sp. C9C3]|uniref:AAA family ATPase n=1 Tax=Herbaspirillum sp. C9C3 TaxID=2735271 RepID=UPI001585082A|nr:ATP-binding protein [Herbaspirillum sp. C9C3]NUT63183.1 ATP-binding protein [Herbaspirillum sp. C9C3]
MFIEFSVENYLSFKDRVTLSLLASKLKSRNRALDSASTFTASGTSLTLLKCAAIYGANASGKSNLFSAMRFMRKFVLESSKESRAKDAIPVTPFLLSTGSRDEPSFFEIAFVANGEMYVYSFSLDSEKIYSEKLTQICGNKEVELFVREEQEIKLDPSFTEGSSLIEKTRSNALFLSVCENFAGDVSSKVIDWFRRLRHVSGLRDDTMRNYTVQCLDEKNDDKKYVDALLQSFDLGIEKACAGAHKDLEIPAADGFPLPLKEAMAALQRYTKDKNLGQRRIETYHNVFDQDGNIVSQIPFDLDSDESQGTRKIVALSAPLVDTLTNAYVLFIDEFDARLHPILTKNILKLFNSESGNPNNAQLVVATHDTNLLDRHLLRRDQVWFCEKDSFGGSHLTSLVEYKVRNDASFEKDYIMGKYGAIPMLGNLNNVFSSSAKQLKEKADVRD